MAHAGHERVVCSKCDKIIRQCRCMEPHKVITFETCDKCAGNPAPQTTGNLVVVGAQTPAYWMREPDNIEAVVIVRDDAGKEWSFKAKCKAIDLVPFYR